MLIQKVGTLLTTTVLNQRRGEILLTRYLYLFKRDNSGKYYLQCNADIRVPVKIRHQPLLYIYIYVGNITFIVTTIVCFCNFATDMNKVI